VQIVERYFGGGQCFELGRFTIQASQVKHELPCPLGGFARSVPFRAPYVLPNVGDFDRPVFALAKCFQERRFQYSVRQILKPFRPERGIYADGLCVERLSCVERERCNPFPN